MKFKTLRTSDTGKKLEQIQIRMHKSRDKTIEILSELGANQYVEGYWCVNSGVSGILFPEGTEIPSYMKKVEQGYYPKLNTTKGRLLKNKLDEIDTIKYPELNACVGLDHKFGCIGISFRNQKYILFSLNEDWKYTPPADCKEITVSEYKLLSGE